MQKQTALKTSQTDAQPDSSLEQQPIDCIDINTHLSSKETRQIVTPYAFYVADELLGTPLAGPFRRGFGLLIDLFFVSLLTQVSSLVLAGVAALTFFQAGNRLKAKKRFNGVRIFLRLLVAILVFVVAMGIVDSINEDNASNATDTYVTSDNIENTIELVALTANYLLETKAIKQQIEQGECEPAYDCLQSLGEKLSKDLVAAGLDESDLEEVLEAYVDGVSDEISYQEKHQLQDYLNEFAASHRATESVDVFFPIESDEDMAKAISEYTNKKVNSKAPKGLLARLDNFIEELGLGLGWAAFYFSVFTAWWKGQTPGKKLMGTKVIKIDNQPLTLFESFGRYGGYAAGLATGLMGFLQVFWDPNRQAIQDKISATLVIDLRKPKVHFVKNPKK